MYYYIYDSFLNNRRYNNILARIENRLTDLGINGKISRLSMLKNVGQVLKEEVEKGVKTIVIVGDDKTVGQMINVVAGLNTIIGFIPIGNSQIANLLNIPEGESACDVLSARIIRKIDLGKINDHYFITSVEMAGQGITIKCDDNYFINLPHKNNIVNISNLNYCFNTETIVDDNLLDLFIQSTKRKLLINKKTSLTHLKGKSINIECIKTIPILLNDEKRIVKTPAKINIAAKKLKIVAGKIIPSKKIPL